jgi:hypothetical protein
MSWNYYRIFSEFRIGTDFRADFALLSANSCGWEAKFIELEGPHDKPYKSDSTPSPKLNWAIRQTNDWRDFVRDFRPTLKHEFAKLLQPHDVHAQNLLITSACGAHIEIEHPRTSVEFDYHVVIGNSQTFGPEHRKAHNWQSGWTGVMTYDRVYDAMVDLESRYSTYEEQVKCLSQWGKED